MKNKKQILKNIMNLIILLLSMELINIIVTEVPEFRNIDLRLVFIFIVANSMGMGYGIISATVSSVLYILQGTTNLSDISIIFLNTNNWLQIVIYLAFAIIIGLKHDKDNLKLDSLKNTIDESKEKEESNNKKIELYEAELKEFNQILLTHKATYIQISEFIEKLNSVKTENTKISELLKEILNNNSCELTNVQTIKKYLDTEKLAIIDKNHIWVNNNLDEEQPMFIAPISIENQDLVIVIWKCQFEQMNMDYRNQIIGIAKIIKYVLSH